MHLTSDSAIYFKAAALLCFCALRTSNRKWTTIGYTLLFGCLPFVCLSMCHNFRHFIGDGLWWILICLQAVPTINLICTLYRSNIHALFVNPFSAILTQKLDRVFLFLSSSPLGKLLQDSKKDDHRSSSASVQFMFKSIRSRTIKLSKCAQISSPISWCTWWSRFPWTVSWEKGKKCTLVIPIIKCR